MKNILFFLFLLSFLPTNAQEELSLFFHEDVFQSGQLQPAYAPNSVLNLGLASSYFHMDFRGPKVSDFFGGNKFLSNLSSGVSNNYLSTDLSFNYIDFAFKKNDWYFRGGYNANTNIYFDFSPDFAKLLTLGNGNSIGKSFDLGPDLYLRQTSELYIGASYPIYEYYRLGGNLKLISGSFDISTPRSNLSIHTGEEIYEITLENDYLINSSFNNLSLTTRELLPFSSPLQDNIGLSADFGFQYLSEDWDVSVSLLDVGVINWKSNATNIKSKGRYSFDGFTISDLTLDTLSLLTDTISSIFDLNVSHKNYLTNTPVKIIVGGEYHYNKWDFGGILYGEWKQNRFLPAVGVNVKRKIWKFWDLGMSYSIKNNTYSNLGFSSVLNIGALQLYLLSDNIVGPFLPATQKKINLRIGANLNFGKFKRAKQAIPNPNKA